MASTDDTSDAAKGAARRGRTAAEQRAEQDAAGSPAALAKEIEQTRDDLAETLDAIADKVSPKRVAKRTSKQAAESVKGGAAVAKEAILSGAASAKEAVVAGAETVKEKVAGAAATNEPEPPAVVPRGPLVEPSPALEPAGLPPVGGVPVPELGTVRPGAATSTAPLRTPSPSHAAFGPAAGAVKKEYVAAALALLGLALLLRFRRK